MPSYVSGHWLIIYILKSALEGLATIFTAQKAPCLYLRLIMPGPQGQSETFLLAGH